MKTSRIIAGFLVSLIIYSGTIGCEATYHSSFAAQSMKPSELAQVKYRMLKPGAMGESTGFKLLWIPISSPTESEAKRDMLDRLRKEEHHPVNPQEPEPHRDHRERSVGCINGLSENGAA